MIELNLNDHVRAEVVLIYFPIIVILPIRDRQQFAEVLILQIRVAT